MIDSLKYKFKIPSINIFSVYLWSIFYLSPFVDAVTGYLVLSNTISESFVGSPSQLFRIFLFGYSIFFIKLKKRVIVYILAILYLWFVEFSTFFVFKDFAALINGLVISYKLVFAIVLFYALKYFFEKNVLSPASLLNYFVKSGLIYAIILILSLILGIGYSTYASQGSKGLFASGNGLSFFLGVVFLAALYNYLENKSWAGILVLIIIFGGLAVIKTKASLIYILVGVFFLFFNLRVHFRLIVVIILVSIFYFYRNEINDLFQLSYQVLLLRFKTSNSVFEALLSGRIYYTNFALQEYNLSSGLFYRIIIGAGYFVAYRNPLDFHTSGYINVMEMDIFDMFFMYGIIGLSIYIFVFARGFLTSLMLKSKYISISWLLIFLNSAFAGHVLFNGMSIMAVVCLYAFINFSAISRKNLNVFEIA